MRIVVTGAAGFIGSHLVERLLRAGHNVLGVDNFDDFYESSRKHSNIQSALAHPAFELSRVDIRAIDPLQDVVEGSDAIIHLAARAGVRPSFRTPSLYADVNVTGTSILLDLARKHGVSRFVFASSSSVYGEGAETPFKEDGALGVPASPYASTKLAGEMLCRNFAAEIPHVAILRLFTVYGPRQRPDLAIHKFARLMLDDEPIPIYGSTGSFRDYTFVSDIVSGLEASLTVEDPWLVCNLGSGRPIELGEMIKALESALEVKATVEHLPSQDGDLFGTWASITRARRKLGYQPQYTFSEGVESFAEWVVSSRRTDR